jgi:hypothetical protein
LSEYYEARGWDDNGVPELDKLHELGLDEYAYIVKDLLKKDAAMEKTKAKAEVAAVEGGGA